MKKSEKAALKRIATILDEREGFKAHQTKHETLWKVCRNQAAYKAGTDTQNHEKPDCSSGCKFFHPLEGAAGMDWGVCTCPKSPRAGLLTFEHMGCKYFDV